MNFIKKSAFTLAETLIVIGILGVIAALTIPNLSSETNNKDTVTKLKKVQSTLEDAFGRMTSHYGPIDEWTTLNTVMFTSGMKGSIKVAKDCAFSTTESCFSPTAKGIVLDNGSDEATLLNADATYGKVLLTDGVSMAFKVTQTASKDCNKDVINANRTMPDLNQVCGIAVIDVNGPGRGKTTWGTDLFAFYITKNGFYPLGSEIDNINKPLTACLQTKGGKGCTAWVVTNDNMDYLKVDASSKCPNGAFLNWTQTKCYD